MLLLDTDHMSLLQRADSLEGKNILARLRAANRPVATSIITFEEQVRGWLTRVSKARSGAQVLQAYSRLSLLLHDYRTVDVVDYDQHAEEEFRRLRAGKLRVGTLDLRIAAIAQSRGATLLTRNTRDFAQIPGLMIDDWTS